MIYVYVLFLIYLPDVSFSEEWIFPDDFKFGVATSAYQVEGGWNAGGKGVNIWDTFTHSNSVAIKDNSNGDVACDSYNKWEEDVMMVKNLGVDYYRFSLAWTRIFPDGYGTRVNQAGVDYYNNLIDKLKDNGIEPVVTLFHWDLPQVFSALGGWSNPTLIQHLSHFARTAFKLFGERVKIWITINEPRLICYNHKGLVGDVTADYPLGTIEYLCVHNLLKAHAEIYHIYDKEFRLYQKGKIAISLDFSWHEAKNSSNLDDVRAAEQFVQFFFGLFANPILNFDYPKLVKDRVAYRSRLEGFPQSRLPKFSLEEKLKIRGTFDFLGINHYTCYYAEAAEEPAIAQPSIETDMGGRKYLDPSWKETGARNFRVVPWALQHLLKWIKTRYQNPEILITENGYADLNETLDDTIRIEYHKIYLKSLLKAIYEDGVRVRGYMVWSLMDNWEWKSGYTVKFGLYRVNFTDPHRARTPKKSVEFFKNVTSTKVFNINS